jgi:sporulation protein YlmC with PRC-barrel domain
MTTRRVHVEHLLGRTVHDTNGRRVGRIEEIKAEDTSGGCVVSEFVLGREGLWQRLSFHGIAPLFIRALAKKGRARAQTVPWQQMDLSNPRRPKIRCAEDEL